METELDNANDPVWVPSDDHPHTNYLRPIPQLQSTCSLAEWKEIITSAAGGHTTSSFYVNQITGEKRSTLPRPTPNLQSFYVEAQNEKLEVFAPTSIVEELGKTAIYEARVESWQELEPYWTSTVASYEHSMSVLKHALSSSQSAAALPGCDPTIAALQRELAASKERERQTQEYTRTLISRIAKSCVIRDDSAFPNGDFILSDFKAAFMHFEAFARDSTNCLEDMKYPDAVQVLTINVMQSIFNSTLSYVEGKLLEYRAMQSTKAHGDGGADEAETELLRLQNEQATFPAQIMALTDEAIADMMKRMDPTVNGLHMEMLRQSQAGSVRTDEHTLFIPQVVRALLRLHTWALLSTPRCYLHPAPGAYVKFSEEAHAEVLSPGAEVHGRIKYGDDVRVVLPGLYFGKPTDNSKPVWRALVHRFVKRTW